MLYINEKLAIASYKKDNILKTRTEIISKWRHVRNLANVTNANQRITTSTANSKSVIMFT